MNNSSLYSLDAVPTKTLTEFREGRGLGADEHVEGLLRVAEDFAGKIGFQAERHLTGGSRSMVLKGLDHTGHPAVLKSSEPHHIADELVGYRYLDSTRLPRVYVAGSRVMLTSYIKADKAPKPVTMTELVEIATAHNEVSSMELEKALKKGWGYPKVLPFTASLRRRLKGANARRASMNPKELSDVEIAENLIEELEQEGIPTAIAHGDFLPKNIHTDLNGVRYALDSSLVLGDTSYDLAMYLSWRFAEETTRLWEPLAGPRLNKMLFVFLALERPFASSNAEERDELLDELRP